MNNSLCLSVMAVTCLGLGAANAQPPSTLPPIGSSDQPALVAPPVNVPLVPGGQAQGGQAQGGQASGTPAPAANTANSGLNDYLVYLRPDACCGKPGVNGFIASEAYMRNGVSVPFGGVYGRVMDPGYMIQGGVRTLFFQPQPDWAWTVEVGVSSAWYRAGSKEQVFLRNFNSQNTVNIGGQQQTFNTVIPNFPVTPTSLNQTYVHLAIGNEYYLEGDAHPADGCCKWRVGWDVGGNYGTEKIDFMEIRHKTGLNGGPMAAIHTDVEIPYGQAIFSFGVRLEYAYIFSHSLQSQNDTDLSQINFLVNGGVRF